MFPYYGNLLYLYGIFTQCDVSETDKFFFCGIQYESQFFVPEVIDAETKRPFPFGYMQGKVAFAIGYGAFHE